MNYEIAQRMEALAATLQRDAEVIRNTNNADYIDETRYALEQESTAIVEELMQMYTILEETEPAF